MHANTLLLVVGVGALVVWAARLRDPQSEFIENLTAKRTDHAEEPAQRSPAEKPR
jgi:hypothetical protein